MGSGGSPAPPAKMKIKATPWGPVYVYFMHSVGLVNWFGMCGRL